jgi:hypothetical protein
MDASTRKEPQMRFIRALIAKAGAEPAGQHLHVHFHQGPQGQPIPCFDPGCESPALTV